MSVIYTPSDLKVHSLPELRALFHKAQQELTQTAYGSQERRQALASLDAIGLAMAKRMAPKP